MMRKTLGLLLVLFLSLSFVDKKQIEINAATYNIIYVVGDGTYVPTEYGVNTLPDPLPFTSKPGHTFDGWFYDEEFTIPAVAGHVIVKETFLYAKYTLNPTYTITFNSLGGSSVSPLNDLSQIPSSLPVPTKSGYIFDGWYYDLVTMTKANSGDVLSSDKTLYASWILKTYSVTYVTNGGTYVSTEYLAFLPDSMPVPIRTGYTFDGWYYNENLTNLVNPGDTLTENVILYAKWLIKSYTVTFKDYDDTILKTEIVTYNSSAHPPVNPIRENYVFIEWDTDYTKIINNIVIYAVYAEKTTTTIENLPDTTGTLEDGEKFVGTVTIEKNGDIYKSTIVLDSAGYEIETLNMPEYILLSTKVYYFTEKNNKFFIGFYQIPDNWLDTGSFQENVLNNSWIIWNLNTGEFARTENTTVHGRLTSRGDGFSQHNALYLEVVIPHNIDDLLSMNVTYKYQHRYLNGSKGAVITVSEQYLQNDKTYPLQLPWFIDITGFYNQLIREDLLLKDLFVDLQIKELEIDGDYKLGFVEYMKENGSGDYSVNSIFTPESKTYELFLGTQNKMWSTGVGVVDFGILSYRYVYKGVVYSNPYPPTDIPDKEVPDAILDPFVKFFQDIFDQVWAFFLKFAPIMIGIVGIISGGLIIKLFEIPFGKKKTNKYRLPIIFIWTVLLYVGFYILI